MADTTKFNFQDMINQGKELGDDIHSKAKFVRDQAEDIRKSRGKKADNTSIIARARNSVLQFPVYITNSGIRVNEAHLIAKFLERMYASYVQQVLSQDRIRSEEDLKDMAFLKDIHVNFKESAHTPNKYYTPIDEIDRMIKESTYNKIYGEGFIAEFKHVEITDPYYISECKRLMHEPLEGFKFEKFKKLGIGGGTYNSEDEKDDEEESEDISKAEEKKDDKKKAEENKPEEKAENKTEEDKDSKKADSKKPGPNQQAYTKDDNKTVTNIEKTRIPDKEYSVEDLKDFTEDPDIQQKIKRAPNGYSVKIDGKSVKVYHKKDKNGRDIFFVPGKDKTATLSVTGYNSRDKSVGLPEILKDVEIKKINGMLPYAIKCSFRVSGTNHMADIDYLIGVKTVMHLVDMKALAKDLPSIMEGSLPGIRKIRYKMGELSWLEYMFDLKGVKKDAAKRLNKSSKWLSTLKRLANAKHATSDISRDLAEIMDAESGLPLPNASLVISKNEVDEILEKTGIDLTNPDVVVKLMEKIFLLCFMIIDGSAGTMKVLMEGQTAWDVQALAQLDAEKNRMDSSAIMQELGKMVYGNRR